MSSIPQSRLYLRKLQSPPKTIVEHLLVAFPQIPSEVWRSRVSRGLVTLSDGTTVTTDSPYRHGLMVFYRREILSEPAAAEAATVLYRDENILVADKPHGMPVTPAGEYLARSLLVHLQERTGIESLTPMHRLDRDTAGIVLLSTRPDVRGSYQTLFAENGVRREYLAIAHVHQSPDWKRCRLENRIEAGSPWYRQQVVEGRPNAITGVELLAIREGFGVFRLIPETGKKHQLRVHMASIGFGIIGDSLYPDLRETDDQHWPLQLLASRLSFTDPFSGRKREFVSLRRLKMDLLTT